MKSLLLFSGNQLKSVTLNQLPESSWHSIQGDSVGDKELIDAVETIPWMNRAIQLRCNALVGLPFALHEGDEGGRELKKTEWPFQFNLSKLLYALYQDYIVYARAYCFINRNLLGGVPTDPSVDYLKRYLPISITPQQDSKRGIYAFKRTISGAVIQIIEPPDMVWWYKPSLKNETGWSKSDAEVGLKASGILGNMDTMLDKFWEQGAVNTTLISVEGDIQEPDKQRIQSWVERNVEGIKNAFRSRIISGKLSSVTLGYALKDLAAKELTDSKREDIATALGVPHSLLFSNAANYATAQQDSLNFYDHTINPDSTALEELLNEKVFDPLGTHLKFHPERLEIYQQLEISKAANVGILVDKGIWTKQEGRVATNQAPTPAEDDPEYAAFTEKPKEPPVPTLPPPTPPALLPANATAAANMSGQDMGKTLVVKDLKDWRTVAQKRLKEGHLQKALEFKSDSLAPSTIGAIRGALHSAVTPADIMRIFDHAEHFASYP